MTEINDESDILKLDDIPRGKRGTIKERLNKFKQILKKKLK